MCQTINDQDIIEPISLLTDFYSLKHQPLPQIEVIDGKTIPEPCQSLLVHECNMTTTLEAYCRQIIRLRVLHKHLSDGLLYRQVLLITEDTVKPVEFGSIKINLNFFSEEAKKLIIEGCKPLGSILNKYVAPHCSKPNLFFAVKPDPMLTELFGLSGSVQQLYGRHTSILNGSGKWIADVVEILSLR